jgi:hypothetical protein
MPLSRIVTLVAIVVIAVSAYGQEKKIHRSDLPRAVQETVAKESSGLPAKEFSEETKDGQTIYEATFWVGFQTKTLFLNPDGKLTEVKEWVSTAAVPPPALQALKTQAGTGKIVRVRTLEKNGTLVAYEAKVTARGKKTHILVDPQGAPLAKD